MHRDNFLLLRDEVVNGRFLKGSEAYRTHRNIIVVTEIYHS